MRARIRRSSPRERWSTYQTSSSIRSSHGMPGATVHLRPSGEPRLDLEPPALTRRVELDLRRQRRARADDRHLAAQHVDEVGHLVERDAAQQPADPRDAGVALEHRRPHPDRVGAERHRPELEQVEHPAVPAGPRLSVDRRAPANRA